MHNNSSAVLMEVSHIKTKTFNVLEFCNYNFFENLQETTRP